MFRAVLSLLGVLTVSGTDLFRRVHWNANQANSLTPVNVSMGSLSEEAVLGVEVTLNTLTTPVNTTVFFTTVFHGELHTWSLDTARERNVTKYLCGLNRTAGQVRNIETKLSQNIIK